MAAGEEVWRPGSFTKNFSWGGETGLLRLHESIRIGFHNKLEDVPRDLFYERVNEALPGSPLIPLNFFLFNEQRKRVDYVVVDELVFQALTAEHSARFDKLAMTAFNLSFAGKFKGANKDQRRPALWAMHYVTDRVAKDFAWQARNINADDIQKFVGGDARWQAVTTRKLATNLNHLYKIGRLGDLGSAMVERWWVDALFLALDRIIADRRIDKKRTAEAEYLPLLKASSFFDLTGKASLEKDLAAKHLVGLYAACGATARFSEEAVRARSEVMLRDVDNWSLPNDDEPREAVHLSNPRIMKRIPAICAMLAVYAGFEVLTQLQAADFDPDRFIRERTRAALKELKAKGIRPTMSAEEVLRMTRGK
jgi:hypothetical protein